MTNKFGNSLWSRKSYLSNWSYTSWEPQHFRHKFCIWEDEGTVKDVIISKRCAKIFQYRPTTTTVMKWSNLQWNMKYQLSPSQLELHVENLQYSAIGGLTSKSFNPWSLFMSIIVWCSSITNMLQLTVVHCRFKAYFEAYCSGFLENSKLYSRCTFKN